jgi:MFS family permease
LTFQGRAVIEFHGIEAAFVTGIALLGAISLAAGFSGDKIVLIVLRALTGIGTSHQLSMGLSLIFSLITNPAAALTIPSALTLIVNVFTEPLEQARAIGLFGGCGSIGNGGLSHGYKAEFPSNSRL